MGWFGLDIPFFRIPVLAGGAVLTVVDIVDVLILLTAMIAVSVNQLVTHLHRNKWRE